jgi:hypothetical protein
LIYCRLAVEEEENRRLKEDTLKTRQKREVQGKEKV